MHGPPARWAAVVSARYPNPNPNPNPGSNPNLHVGGGGEREVREGDQLRGVGQRARVGGHAVRPA